MPIPHLEVWFPKLRTDGYRVTSPSTPRYNCIAWAAGRDNKWWWPPMSIGGYYWPTGIPTSTTIDSFIKAFELDGYQKCDDADLDPAYEKIALYVDSDRTATHAARQLESGAWTSKLGRAEDIEHNTLSSLEGETYGSVAQIMRRPQAS